MAVITESTRWCLVPDRDNHWYVIPIEMYNTFHDLLESGTEFIQDLEWVWIVKRGVSTVSFTDWLED